MEAKRLFDLLSTHVANKPDKPFISANRGKEMETL
jgi:hypothetical protein